METEQPRAKLLGGPVWPFNAIFFKFYSLDSGHVHKIVSNLERRRPGWSPVRWCPGCPSVTVDTGQGPVNCQALTGEQRAPLQRRLRERSHRSLAWDQERSRHLFLPCPLFPVLSGTLSCLVSSQLQRELVTCCHDSCPVGIIAQVPLFFPGAQAVTSGPTGDNACLFRVYGNTCSLPASPG